MNQNKDLFYCYNPKMRRFLREAKNIRWIEKGVNKNSGFPYWIFKRSLILDKAIREFKEKR